MFCLTVKDVLRECNGKLFHGNENLMLEHFSKDTRTIQENDVYLGIYGENFDGNEFYLEALKKGAKCCILDHFDSSSWNEKWNDRTIIIVPDTILAIQKLATFKRNHIDIPVIAVTGSVGKTSTKDMIAEILKQKYRVFKSPGNLNGQIGLPLNILELQDEEVMVLEMGMNNVGQISTLTHIAKPNIGVITNIGTAHIGILGSRENILKAKLEILEGMAKGSKLVINQDNDMLSHLHLNDYEIHGCGIESSSEYSVSHIRITEKASSFEVCYHDKGFDAVIPVMGEVFVMNSLLAIAVGDLLGLNPKEIADGLKNFSLSSNRMEILSLNKNIIVINDTYNSNYEALINAIDILIKYPGKRKIAVLGDVLEMDDYAEEMHCKIGMIPALKEVDLIFLQGKDSYYIKKGALKQNIDSNKIFYFENKNDLMQELLSYIQNDDTILVKASNGMKFGEIVDLLKYHFK